MASDACCLGGLHPPWTFVPSAGLLPQSLWGWPWNTGLPQLWLMNQEGLGKKGKSIHFMSLLRAVLVLGSASHSRWILSTNVCLGNTTHALVSIITGAEGLPCLTALHREVTELIFGADRSHLRGFIEGYEAGFTVSVNAPSWLCLLSPWNCVWAVLILSGKRLLARAGPAVSWSGRFSVFGAKRD